MKGEEFTVGDKVETTTTSGVPILCTVICRAGADDGAENTYVGEQYELDSPAHGYVIARSRHEIKLVEKVREA